MHFILQLLLGPYLEMDFFATLGRKWAGCRILWISFLPEVVGIESIGVSVGILERCVRGLCLARYFGRRQAARPLISS